MAQNFRSNGSPHETLASSSFTSSSSPTSRPPSPPLIKTSINAGHYQKLLEDNIPAFRNQVSDLSELVRVSDNSSILHIAASTGQSQRMIDHIVLQSPQLLRSPNSMGDLPVHASVRAGHLGVVKNLVSLADQVENYSAISMLEHENAEKNTALHIALENQQEEMAEYLFRICLQTYCCWNTQEISPLYLAIKAGFWALVGKMVDRGDELGPGISKDELRLHSVVHAVIMAKNKGILEKILEQYPDEVLYSMDESGRRPLSYAAYIGFQEGVVCILTKKDEIGRFCFQNQAFKTDKDGSFPIHIACRGGHIHVVKELLFRLPENMRWLLNQKAQSILHVAAESGKAEVVKYLLRQPKLVTMINMKDQDGNTALHLATLGKHPNVVYDLTWDSRVKLNLQSKLGSTALDIAEDYKDVPSFEERLTWLALMYAGVPRAPLLPSPNADHHEGTFFSPAFMVTEQGNLVAKTHPKKRKNKYKERINTLLIISTLVATVTFASGFTVPGGYNNSGPKEGMATLDHKCAFQVFVITNTIALYSSILAIVTLIWAHLDDLRLILLSLDFALPLLGTALAMMSVAFMAGLYVVLHDMFWLGVVVLVMGGVFLGALLVFIIPLYSPSTCIKYKIMRYFLHVPFKLMLMACQKGNNSETI